VKVMKSKLVFLFLLYSSEVFCQVKYSEIEKFLNIVGFIYEQRIVTERVENKTLEIWYRDAEKNSFNPKLQTKTGTCFFIGTGLDFYLVTASHVAQNSSLNTRVIISSRDEKAIKLNLKDMVAEKDTLNWTTHPHADVAVIHLDEKFVRKNMGRNFFFVDMLNIKLEAPIREREVTVYGFPLSLGVSKNISAITKTSKPSSGLIELPRFDNKEMSTFFLLDDPSVSGFSGGPVLELPQQIGTADKAIWVRAYRVMGLVHGSISDKSGGFAAIVPSRFIKQTIEYAPGLTDTLVITYEDKTVWSKIFYKNGIPWTVFFNLTKNGESQEMGSLKEGNGTLYNYDENGKLLDIREYVNGHLESLDRKN